jgi:hypothetical protein
VGKARQTSFTTSAEIHRLYFGVWEELQPCAGLINCSLAGKAATSAHHGAVASVTAIGCTWQSTTDYNGQNAFPYRQDLVKISGSESGIVEGNGDQMAAGRRQVSVSARTAARSYDMQPSHTRGWS